jgi:hypothetical protein
MQMALIKKPFFCFDFVSKIYTFSTISRRFKEAAYAFKVTVTDFLSKDDKIFMSVTVTIYFERDFLVLFCYTVYTKPK